MVGSRWMTGAAALLALAACDGGGPPTKTKSITLANPFQEKLAGLSEVNRSMALRRAVQDTGEPCKRIEASGYQGMYKSLHMWTARCSEGRDWGLFIAPNGDVQVRSCEHLKSLGLPECRFETAAS
jgi:hypothetical protein